MSSDFDKIIGMPWIRLRNEYDYQKFKQQLEEQPEGYRTLFSSNLHKTLFRDKQDLIKADNGQMVRGIWHDKSIETTKQRYDHFFKNLKQTGAKLDYLIVDIERGNDYQKIHKRDTKRKNLSLRAIANDPRFKSEGWDKKWEWIILLLSSKVVKLDANSIK